MAALTAHQGVILVESFDELIDVAALLVRFPEPADRGRRRDQQFRRISRHRVRRLPRCRPRRSGAVAIDAGPARRRAVVSVNGQSDRSSAPSSSARRNCSAPRRKRCSTIPMSAAWWRRSCWDRCSRPSTRRTPRTASCAMPRSRWRSGRSAARRRRRNSLPCSTITKCRCSARPSARCGRWRASPITGVRCGAGMSAGRAAPPVAGGAARAAGPRDAAGISRQGLSGGTRHPGAAGRACAQRRRRGGDCGAHRLSGGHEGAGEGPAPQERCRRRDSGDRRCGRAAPILGPHACGDRRGAPRCAARRCADRADVAARARIHRRRTGAIPIGGRSWRSGSAACWWKSSTTCG